MMPIVVSTPSAAQFPAVVLPPFVEVKQNWIDPWIPQPDLVLTRVSTSSAGQDMGQATFQHRYGITKPINIPTIGSWLDRNYDDWWVRVRSMAEVGGVWIPETIWLGRVSSEDAAEFASSTVPTGVQQWTAFGSEQLLRLRMVGKSFHAVATHGTSLSGAPLPTTYEVSEVGWVPPMNNSRGSEIGNRSENPHDLRGTGFLTYAYGGTSGWTNRQHIDYLLEAFMNSATVVEPPDLPVAPRWVLTGLVAPLEKLQTPIQWRPTQTVFQMLRQLIPLDRGLDFVVRLIPAIEEEEWDRGFEVFVFALSRKVFSFAGVTLPANPDQITLDAGNSADLHPPPRIVTTHDRKYKRIRILGQRIMVCGSLWGSKAPRVARVPETTIGIPDRVLVDDECLVPSSVKKWDDAIETEYKTGGGIDEADHDTYRKQGKFRDVYCSVGAPLDWDFNGGTAAPWVDGVGEVRLDDPATPPPDDESQAPFQRAIRRTLSRLPMRRGEDWTNIATAPTLARGEQTDVDEHQADFLPPVAYIFDPGLSIFEQSSKIGIGVQPQQHEWGIVLQCEPNYVMGREHFGTSQGATVARYDWEEMILTIAWESDYRYTMEWADPFATPEDATLEIEVPAEMHYLAPNTVVALPEPPDAVPQGTLDPLPDPPLPPPPTLIPPDPVPTPRVILSGNAGRVIRADKDLMGLTMAGAISRYGDSRRRANVTIQGLSHFHGLVGGMLGTVFENGVAHQVNGPITGVTWNLPMNSTPTTTIRGGFAK